LDEEHGFQIAYFSNDSYQLNSKAKKLLKEIAAGADSTNCISLRGYADPSGNETYNRRLAKRRAESVQKYLLKLGVDPEQVVIEFFDILHNEKAADNRICTILVL
jgi:outer membrane protein OmpA-like peptidoglycan-associated protein